MKISRIYFDTFHLCYRWTPSLIEQGCPTLFLEINHPVGFHSNPDKAHLIEQLEQGCPTLLLWLGSPLKEPSSVVVENTGQVVCVCVWGATSMEVSQAYLHLPSPAKPCSPFPPPVCARLTHVLH